MSETMLWGTACVALVLLVVALSATWVRLSRYQVNTDRPPEIEKTVVIKSLSAELRAHSSSPLKDQAEYDNERNVRKRSHPSVIVNLPLADLANPDLHKIVIPAKKRNLRIAA